MMTVSRVLNHRDGVSQEVRERILKIQQKYNYKTVYSSRCKCKIAVCVFKEHLNDVYMRILSGISNYIHNRDMEVALIYTDYNYENLLNTVRDMQCSVLVIPSVNYFSRDITGLRGSDLPIILLDPDKKYKNAGIIGHDSYGGSCEATQFLLDNGHRNIGYLSHGEEIKGDHKKRLNGYRDTLQKAGITPDKSFIRAVNVLEKKLKIDYWDAVEPTVRLLLEDHPETTAIMTIDDSLALPVMQVLQENGYNIPEDISVIGFDCNTESGFYYPALTTVKHPLEEAGFLAAQMAEQVTDTPGDWPPAEVILKTNLVIRKSVKNIGRLVQ